MTQSTHWGISLGNLGSFQDGLGEFSWQLCSRIADRAAELHDRHRVRICFQLRESLRGCFGDQVDYLPISRWQRFRHVQTNPFAIWHSLNQINKVLPPLGTQTRIVTVHDLNFLYFKGAYSRWRDMRRLRVRLDRTDCLVTISNYVRADVLGHLPWQGRTEVIYNGARNLSGAPQQAVAALQGRPYMFHLSRLSPSKNIVALLRLAQAWPEMAFVLAGPSGRDSRAVQREVRSASMPNVTVMLSISDAQKSWLFANCLAFLFPSLSEGFGLPPIEAMHFGKPVFLSDRTSLPEVGGDAAVYWHDFEAAAMKRVVVDALASFSALDARRVRERAASFSWDRCAERYVELYLSLVAARKLGQPH